MLLIIYFLLSAINDEAQLQQFFVSMFFLPKFRRRGVWITSAKLPSKPVNWEQKGGRSGKRCWMTSNKKDKRRMENNDANAYKQSTLQRTFNSTERDLRNNFKVMNMLSCTTKL